jgi:hypothetical protein
VVAKTESRLTGTPASGKSRFSLQRLPTYTRINQDTLGTKEKCVAAANAALGRGESVVIDNTNATPELRALYVNLATKHRMSMPTNQTACWRPLLVAQLANSAILVLLQVYRLDASGSTHLPILPSISTTTARLSPRESANEFQEWRSGHSKVDFAHPLRQRASPRSRRCISYARSKARPNENASVDGHERVQYNWLPVGRLSC